jgi:hypothetical protein
MFVIRQLQADRKVLFPLSDVTALKVQDIQFKFIPLYYVIMKNVVKLFAHTELVWIPWRHADSYDN